MISQTVQGKDKELIMFTCISIMTIIQRTLNIELCIRITRLSGHYRHTHLPRARLHIWFTAYISPLVCEKILDEKHQTGFRSMVHSYHIPDTLSEKDVPVVTTREDNLPQIQVTF